MANEIKYHAYLVKDGVIGYISPVNTRQGAINLVKYWKKNRPIFAESFAASVIPEKWKKRVEEYWIEYKKAHPKTESRFDDPDELPFY